MVRWQNPRSHLSGFNDHIPSVKSLLPRIE
jgi:hypothetical protein